MTTAESVELNVVDDGVGFVAGERTSDGLGLRSIHERVRFLQGHVSVDSRPGEGTKVLVRIPIGAARNKLRETTLRRALLQPSGARSRLVDPRMFVSRLLQNLRHACRVLRRQPAFSGVAILTLALGIGATTAVFTVVYGVLLRPLPYRDPGRLVMLLYGHQAQCRRGSPRRTFGTMRLRTTPFRARLR